MDEVPSLKEGTSFLQFILFVPQGLYGVEEGGLPCRVEAEEYPHEHGKAEGKDY